MANLTKLEFTALDISGNNYLTWVLDAKIHLNSMNLGKTIKDGNEESEQNKARLDMSELHLRLQDFKTVNEYNFAMFKIVSQLRLCGDNVTEADMLEKTFTTFHGSNMLLQQQYRKTGFKKYFELISCLLVAEQNNNLLMKYHNSHPTVVVVVDMDNREKKNKGNTMKFGPSKKQNESCYKCGTNGNWKNVCRTPRHLVDLYQASIKGKGKAKEINFIDFNNHVVDNSDPMDFTYFDRLVKHNTMVMRPIMEINLDGGDICLVDNGTTYTIPQDQKYFSSLKLAKTNDSTFSGTTKIVDGFGRDNIILPDGTNIFIKEALHAYKLNINLLSFKDIRLCIRCKVSCEKHVKEKLPVFSSGLYYETISAIESNLVMNKKFNDPKLFKLWHD
ncbi:hypothetical protein ACP275_12G053600 [Erythranthe tilingii]